MVYRTVILYIISFNHCTSKYILFLREMTRHRRDIWAGSTEPSISFFSIVCYLHEKIIFFNRHDIWDESTEPSISFFFHCKYLHEKIIFFNRHDIWAESTEHSISLFFFFFFFLKLL